MTWDPVTLHYRLAPAEYPNSGLPCSFCGGHGDYLDCCPRHHLPMCDTCRAVPGSVLHRDPAAIR